MTPLAADPASLAGGRRGVPLRLRWLVAAAVILTLAPAPIQAAAHVTRHRARRAAPTMPPGALRQRRVTLEWVGDIALSGAQGLPPGGVRHALAPVRALLRRADITAGNLEGTLSVGGSSKCGGHSAGNCFAFQAPPFVAHDLASTGFDILNQANNHALDFGPSGQAQTLAALGRAHLAHTGLPGGITVVKAKGVRVALVGFAPYTWASNLLDIPGARRLVARARARAPIVIVLIHAGAEGAGQFHTPRGHEFFLGEDRGDARAFAHAVIDAGAAAVLGSGPHVIRGIERYRGRLIAYSLGNFVGYHTLAGGGTLSESAILRFTLDSHGRLLAGDWIAVTLSGGLPRPDPTRASTRLMLAVSKADFPGHRFVIGPSGRFHLAAAPPAP